MTSPSIDLDRLPKLRLVVARFGEMDGATPGSVTLRRMPEGGVRIHWLAERFQEIQTAEGDG